MYKDQLKLELKQFKYHVQNLIRCEDRLSIIAEKLCGDIKSSAAPKVDAGKVSATIIKSDNIVALMFEEEELTAKRDYHLYAVNRIRKLLIKLDNEDVILLELHYWEGYDMRLISSMVGYSLASTHRMFDSIYEKMEHVPQKNRV